MQTRNTRSILIATVCTSDAPPQQMPSPAAVHVHDEWQLGAQPYAKRRIEDVRACATLGAQPIHLDLLDAIYRHDVNGEPFYVRDFIGIAPQAEDIMQQLPRIVRALNAVLSQHANAINRIYAPLALGGHVDHTITRQACEIVAEAWRTPLSYYEDYPYAEQDASLHSAQVRGLVAQTIALDELAIRARVAAICEYPSQLQPVFKLADRHALFAAVEERVRKYTSCVGGERYWRKSTP